MPPITLGAIGITYGGLTGKSKKDFGHGHGRYVTFLEVMSDARLEGRALGRVAVGPTERQNEVRRGDILFNGSSETPDEVALSTVVSFEVPAGVYLNSFCFGYRLNRSGEADATYLAYFFRSSVGRGLVSALAQGATRYNIAKTKLLRVPLELPPFEEQKRIAGALTCADDHIVSLERLIAKKRAIRQGSFQALLSGRIRLPGFTEDWEEVTVGAIADVKTGPFGSSLHAENYVASGTPIITVEHLGEFGVEALGAPMVSGPDRRRLQAYVLAEGDIVFSRVGSIDRSARITPAESGWLFSGRLLRVRFTSTSADSVFMSYQFQTERFIEAIRSVAVGQTMPSLNTTILRGIAVRRPPIDEQQAIGAVLSATDREIQVLERRLQSVRRIKQGMMQELLSGRTRLKAEAEA